MKITYLGQAGLLFETGGLTIISDPYLSDSVERIEPHNKRRVPVDERFLHILPDVLICTHDHLDHTDPDTLRHYLNQSEKKITVLASEAAWKTVSRFGGVHHYVCFNRHTEWTEGTVRFRAVKAEHSERHAIGVLIEAEEKTYYITGDTLYNTEIFEDVPKGVDAVFLPVNGVGNNLNMADAKRFCEQIQPKVAVPLHCGLFDNIDRNTWEYPDKVIAEYYREIRLP